MDTPDTTIPLLAVIKPTESMLVTSSYVNVPPIDTSPDTFNEERVPRDVIFGCAAVCIVPVGLPVRLPTKVVAVTTPDEFMLLNTDVPVVLIPAIPLLSPVNPDPSPTKLVAVTTPLELICLDAISTTDMLGVPVKP